MPDHAIRYLSREEIDATKWDRCIDLAPNGLLYACSTYLDCMSSNRWDALVSGDYEIVMPLPYKKKYGIYYLYQPAITPVLGVFGNNLSPELVHAFLDQIPAKFKLWDISLNHFNAFDKSYYKTFSRANFILTLETPYEKISGQYHTNIKRNLSKALKSKCIVKKDIPIDAVIDICKKTFSMFTRIEKGLFVRLKNVYEKLAHQSAIYGVYSSEGQLLASAVFIFFKERVYYWLVGNDRDSRKYGASSLLLDTFIHDNASKKLLLDFEGSDADSVASFYKKFGARSEPYTTIYNNRLPFLFRKLKPLPSFYRSLPS